jgi:trehalose 6-phosphate synthase
MKQALIVNPYDVEEMADAIKVALEMGLQERQDRHQALLTGIRTHCTFAWCRSFLSTLENVRRRKLEVPFGSPSDAAMKALQEIELARVAPRVAGSG